MRLKQCSLLFTIILISLPAAWICVSAQVAGIGTINYPSFKADPTKNFTYNDTYWVTYSFFIYLKFEIDLSRGIIHFTIIKDYR